MPDKVVQRQAELRRFIETGRDTKRVLDELYAELDDVDPQDYASWFAAFERVVSGIDTAFENPQVNWPIRDVG